MKCALIIVVLGKATLLKIGRKPDALILHIYISLLACCLLIHKHCRAIRLTKKIKNGNDSLQVARQCMSSHV